MYKYRWNNDLAYATSVLRIVAAKKGKTIYEVLRSQKTDVRRQEEERRHVNTKRDNAKWLNSPNVCYFQNHKHYEHWMMVANEEKWQRNWVC